MNKTLSIYLDFLRFFSAILVFLFHARYSRFDGAWLSSVGAYGHDAVIVFFVLSGFVIAYIANAKEALLWDYSKSRLARLYSVVVPALLLTLVLDYAGNSIDASLYSGGHYQASEPIKRFFANLFFVNEIWFTSWRAFSNGPFWSLSYEFWYYVIFACYFYFKGLKRWGLVIMATLIAGPKIVILFPVWLAGVLVYHLGRRVTLGKVAALSFFIVPVIIYFIYRDMNGHKFLLNETVNLLGRDFVYKDLKWSRRFISDYFVGALLAIHLLGALFFLKDFSVPVVAAKVIRYFAGMTFALYLFHYPILQFYGSFASNGKLITALTFVSILLLAPFTEGKKKKWYILIDGLFFHLKRLIKLVKNDMRS